MPFQVLTHRHELNSGRLFRLRRELCLHTTGAPPGALTFSTLLGSLAATSTLVCERVGTCLLIFLKLSPAVIQAQQFYFAIGVPRDSRQRWCLRRRRGCLVCKARPSVRSDEFSMTDTIKQCIACSPAVNTSRIRA